MLTCPHQTNKLYINMAKRKNLKQPSFNKRYIKLLSVLPPRNSLTNQLIKSAPVPIVKLISNAAIHALRGKVNISNNTRQKFRKNRKLFNILSNKSYNFNQKKRALVQKGGASILPLILSTVLAGIGPLLFKN